MVLASQLRPGMAIAFENSRYRVLIADYHPGQGKMGGVTHARLQNLDTGTFREISLRADLRFQELPSERRSLDFLYADGDRYCFMDPDSFEQFEIAEALLGARAVFLESGMKLPIDFVESQPIGAQFPDIIEVRIADTASAAHQQGGDNTFKPARLANGVQVMVPQFIKTGDSIRLDLGTMKYVDRGRAAGR